MHLNCLGYPMVSNEIHRKLFGTEDRPKPDKENLDRAISYLKGFNVETPVPYPEGMYDGPLPLPSLKGENIRDHFENIAKDQIGIYKELADDLAQAQLPQIPDIDSIVLNPGWTRYTIGEDSQWVTEKVSYPLERAFTFDTETFVVGGAFPIIGTALSTKAAYIWIADELIDPSLPKEEWVQYEMIPVGENRFIAGHNISYDRVRAAEGYSLKNTAPENFYFDTLSAHVAVSGLAGGQRWLYVLAGKEPDEMTEEEKQKLRFAPPWLEAGSTNSLVECYNFHVYEVRKYFGDEKAKKLGYADKEVRDLFVKGQDLGAIRQGLFPALEYAMKDAFYTAELFQAIWPKYLDSTPSMVALAGHYYLNGSVVPLVPDWQEWMNRTEKVYDEFNEEMTALCRSLVNKYYDEWTASEDPNQYWNSDPWLRQLDWEVKSQKGKYAGVPTWMRQFIRDPETKISTKSQLSHLLLKLEWEGLPIVITKTDGWCVLKSTGWEKIPHPKGNGDNVGGVLNKEFVEDMASGRLRSQLPEALRALEIANGTSYWTSVRKRVMSRLFMKTHNPHGEDAYVTLPEILAHGTTTRRTVEPLMVTMCSTKSWRIGTELKTRVQAPDGWKIVGADFDGQEMQIAASYCDSWDSGIIGGSPMGFNVLSGSKELGTDPHSALAKTVGVDRDTAKIAGFAMLYGAGAKAVTGYIRKKYPEKPDNEVRTLANNMLKAKKGVRITKQSPLEGGSDSGCYNYMEQIAMKTKIPQLPCLGTKISTALRPAVVGDDFATSRTNWTIQASGSEILATILVATHWLMREFKVEARFVISIHDEIHWMVPDKHAEIFAVLYQIAHMYTWSLFHNQVNLPDLPLSRAFFSSVAIDSRIRKSPNEKTVTPSNPQGVDEPAGVEYSMRELSEIGAIDKLKTRFSLVQRGLL